jgi:hypothetical protein
MNDWLRPTWLRVAVMIAVLVGIALAAWLFGRLSAPPPLPLF